MSRLLTIVNERKKIRGEYRRHLEEEYVAERKAEEQTAREEAASLARENGESAAMMSHEVAEMLKERDQRRSDRFQVVREELVSKLQGGDGSKAIAPLLDEEDVAFIAQSRQKMTQKDILRSHVKNWADLDLKQRRKVMGHIQAQRAKHAKEIFLKELAAIGS